MHCVVILMVATGSAGRPQDAYVQVRIDRVGTAPVNLTSYSNHDVIGAILNKGSTSADSGQQGGSTMASSTIPAATIAMARHSLAVLAAVILPLIGSQALVAARHGGGQTPANLGRKHGSSSGIYSLKEADHVEGHEKRSNRQETPVDESRERGCRGTRKLCAHGSEETRPLSAT